jgi:hypothetical protein
MKYYFDVNAIVHLMERGIEGYGLFKDTYVSKLVVDEMFKNLEKNYSRQRNQFVFMKKNKINIDWRFCETMLFLKPFNFRFEYHIRGPRMFYDSIIKYENYDDYIKNGKPEDEINNIVMPLIDKAREGIQNYYFERIFLNLKYLKKNFRIEKPYITKKDLLNEYLDIGIKIMADNNLLKTKIEKEICRKRGLKYYYKSTKAIDYYINATIELLKLNNENIERNDAIDLYHLSYIDRANNDIFVTNDGKLREICNKVEKDSAISLSDYLKRV